MDAHKHAEILADLLQECEHIIESRRNDYDALPTSGTAMSGGLLSGAFQKVDSHGLPALPPWETTPLRALALHMDIATPIAAKHGATVQEVLRIGGTKLPDFTNDRLWASSGASTYFVGQSILNYAAYWVADEGWGRAIELATDQNGLLAHERAENERIVLTQQSQTDAMREHMRQIQGDGASATSSKAGNLHAKMIELFNEYRRRKPFDHDTDAYDHVAWSLNAHDVDGHRTETSIYTLQNKPHSQTSVKNALSKHGHLLIPRRKKEKQ
jgi:hypothetical protein